MRTHTGRVAMEITETLATTETLEIMETTEAMLERIIQPRQRDMAVTEMCRLDISRNNSLAIPVTWVVATEDTEDSLEKFLNFPINIENVIRCDNYKHSKRSFVFLDLTQAVEKPILLMVLLIHCVQI